MISRTPGIYKITCLANGKIYVGSAVNLRGRRHTHWHRLRKNKHHNKHLQNAWNKYGEEQFVFEVIEFCDKQMLIEREQFFIDFLNSCATGYNFNPIAGSTLGRKDSPETIQKKIEARKRWSFSEETKKKIGDAIRGRKLSDEHCKKISQNKKGVKFKRLRLKLIKNDKEFFPTTMCECLEILGISKSKRTMIYEVVNGRKPDLNGFKIINLR